MGFQIPKSSSSVCARTGGSGKQAEALEPWRRSAPNWSVGGSARKTVKRAAAETQHAVVDRVGPHLLAQPAEHRYQLFALQLVRELAVVAVDFGQHPHQKVLDHRRTPAQHPPRPVMRVARRDKPMENPRGVARQVVPRNGSGGHWSAPAGSAKPTPWWLSSRCSALMKNKKRTRALS